MEYNINYQMKRIEEDQGMIGLDQADRIYRLNWRLDQLQLYVPDHPDIHVLQEMLQLET
jgi:hypothetical protein